MPRAAYAAVEAEFLTNNHRSEGETYYSYDTETCKVKSGADIDEYEGAGLINEGKQSMPPSSLTTSTYPGCHCDWALGKRVYKKWILVVNNISGEVRQYMVYTKLFPDRTPLTM